MMQNQTDQYTRIIERCFINAPFDQLQTGLLDLFLKHRLRPEIGLEGNCLWTTHVDEFKALAEALQENGLQCTLHAPFFDLAPGGIDPKILDVSREKLRRAFQLIKILQPKSIICHLGFDENKHSYKFKEWLRTSVTTWEELLAIAAEYNTPVMFENTYETTPEIHRELFERLDYTHLGFCLDVGHLMAYAGTTWQLWLDQLLPRLKQLHLHDNDGDRDDHIAIGEGCFDFHELFNFLDTKNLSPLITLEPHSEKDLWLALQNLSKMDLF